MKEIKIHDVWQVNDFAVYYTNETNGGGNGIGDEYFDLIMQRYPDRTFDRALEWCAGPGFIGYGLLSLDLCKHISFNEIFQPALDMLALSKLRNPEFSDNINIYPGSTLDLIPQDEKFDLVVANPPHFLSNADAGMKLGYHRQGMTVSGHLSEILVDANWEAHENFYNKIKSRLSKDGIILIQENQSGSTRRSSDFKVMIENAGLVITDEFNSSKYYDKHGMMQIYYIEVRHA